MSSCFTCNHFQKKLKFCGRANLILIGWRVFRLNELLGNSIRTGAHVNPLPLMRGCAPRVCTTTPLRKTTAQPPTLPCHGVKGTNGNSPYRPY